MNHDMETPSIVVEPPSEEVDLIDGGHTPSLSALQSFYGMYQDATSSSGNASTEQGLFSTPVDLSPLSSGQISPLITTGLRDAQSGNMFLSASGQNSPIEASSPASTSSGDLFPENWSDCSSQWSPSHDSSSHPSSPSMSPINTSMLNFTFNDPPYLEATFQQPPAANRMRSNSYSGGSESPPEASNNSRPRSASFTNVNDHVPNTFFHVESVTIPQWDPSFQTTGFVTSPSLPNDFPALDTNIYGGNASPSFGSPTSPNYSPVNEGWNVPEPSGSPLPTFMNYPSLSGPPQNSNPMMTSHSRSQSTHLTVPLNASLQRRGAHRRSHSHTGVHEHTSSPTSPTFRDPVTRGFSPSTRGRQISPSFTPNHSRPSSAASFNYEPYFQEVDQSAAFLNINPATQIPSNMSDSSSSFLSPSPGPSSASQSPAQSPVAPAIELAVPDFTGSEPLPAIKVDDSLIRRHSYAGGSHVHANCSPETLHRAASDPLGRGHKARTRPPYQGLLRPQKEVDESSQFRDFSSMMIDVPVEGIASTSAATSPLSSDSEHKDIVASHKIVDASYKRRKKPGEQARFVCPICHHNFTAKHNLNNHINSHNGIKPFKCDVCKQTFTTSGTAKRHQNNCSGKTPRKRP